MKYFFIIVLTFLISNVNAKPIDEITENSVANKLHYEDKKAIFTQEDIDKGRIILKNQFANYPESSFSEKIDIPIIDGIEYCGLMNDNIKKFIKQLDLGYPTREMNDFYDYSILKGEIKEKHKEGLDKLNRSLLKDKINPEYIKILNDLSYENSLCASNLLAYLYSTETTIHNNEKAVYFALHAMQIQATFIKDKKVTQNSDYAIPFLASRVLDNFESFNLDDIQTAYFLLDFHAERFNSLFGKFYLAEFLTDNYQFLPFTSGLRSKNKLDPKYYEENLKKLLSIFRDGYSDKFYETNSDDEIYKELFNDDYITNLENDFQNKNQNIKEGNEFYASCAQDYNPFSLNYIDDLPPFKIRCKRKYYESILTGDSPYTNKRNALSNLEQMSLNGDSQSSDIVAAAYCRGRGTKVDEIVSKNYYLKSLAQGYHWAKVLMVDGYLYGKCGFEKDQEKAEELINQAIEDSKTEKMYHHERGNYIDSLYDHAIYKKAEIALFNNNQDKALDILEKNKDYLGLFIFSLGRISFKDALIYLNDCYLYSDVNYSICSNELGRVFRGDFNETHNQKYGSEKDLIKSCRFFKEAALSGLEDSFYLLANCYEKGYIANKSNDFKANPIKAAYWYKTSLEIDNLEDKYVFNFLDNFPEFSDYLKNYKAKGIDVRTSDEFFGKNRISIVIGSTNYKNESLVDIPQAKHDYYEMENILPELGFRDVDANILNPSYDDIVELRQSIFNKFKDKNTPLEIIFYYSGHALTYNNVNYIIPVNARIDFQDDFELKANLISLDSIRNTFQQISSLENIIFILDSCRTNLKGDFAMTKNIEKEKSEGNIFPTNFLLKDISQGLSSQSPMKNELIVYSTSPGSVSVADKKDYNSMFTKHLINWIYTNPNKDIETILKNVRNSVTIETNNKQIPWTSSTLTKPFFFPRKNPVRYNVNVY